MTCIWKMYIVPAVLCRFWVNWIVPVYSIPLVGTVHEATLKDALDKWDIIRTENEEVYQFFRSAPGGVPTQTAFSQDRYYSRLDGDRENGVIRNAEHAYSKDGGLAVLYGNIALDGCIVKTAGVDDSILKFNGTARIFESQDACCRRNSG